jgi:hypothetical protein
MTSRLPAAVAGTALLALVGLAGLTGCSSSSGDGSGDSSGSAAVPHGAAADADAPANDTDSLNLKTTKGEGVADTAYGRGDTGDAGDTALEPALIKRGTIGLESDDVAQARLDARHVIDTAGGTVDDEETTASKDGEVTSVRMVLRVPAAKYDDVSEQLRKIATLTDASSSSTDVRDRIIRTHVEIGVQRDAIKRIRILLHRAANIGDIIRIESELTDRIARLDTLRRTAAYLADQTSTSTINLYIEKKASEKPAPPEKKRTGFLGGLHQGWDAFTATVVWLGAAIGTLLPFALALALVGVPLGWLLRRRFRRVGVTPDAA